MKHVLVELAGDGGLQGACRVEFAVVGFVLSLLIPESTLLFLCSNFELCYCHCHLPPACASALKSFFKF